MGPPPLFLRRLRHRPRVLVDVEINKKTTRKQCRSKHLNIVSRVKYIKIITIDIEENEEEERKHFFFVIYGGRRLAQSEAGPGLLIYFSVGLLGQWK